MTWDVTVHAVEGARFVDPDEYRQHKQQYIRGEVNSMVNEILTDALANAADAEGVIPDFDQVDFYTTHLQEALRDETDDDEYRLSYDRFSAMALTDALGDLLLGGLLANRGKGDSHDFRLALPR